jgi:hypothetical protein
MIQNAITVCVSGDFRRTVSSRLVPLNGEFMKQNAILLLTSLFVIQGCATTSKEADAPSKIVVVKVDCPALEAELKQRSGARSSSIDATHLAALLQQCGIPVTAPSK